MNKVWTSAGTPSQVQKRGGSLQDFDPGKIRRAVYGAVSDAFEGDIDGSLEERIDDVCVHVAKALQGHEQVTVDEVQDEVEKALMRCGMTRAARAYILWRDRRERARRKRQGPMGPEAIADYLTLSKYSRYQPSLFRREVYDEAVKRVEEMHLERFPQAGELIRWAFDHVRDKKALPSMRSMQFGGEAIETVEERIYNCSYSPIDRVEFFREMFFLLLCGCGVGFSVQGHHVQQLPPLSLVDRDDVRHHVVTDSIQGWGDALHALITSYVEGYYVEFSYHQIRDKGEPLRTSGGKAPGHLPLKAALERIRGILDGAQGRRLKPIECHDITCIASDAVLAGGIRRSALISLFDVDDEEMINAKTGDWCQENKTPWRARANNSAVLVRDKVTREQFFNLFEATREWGEPGFFFCNDRNYGTNPCVTADTWVTTSEGARQVRDLIGKPFRAAVNGELHDSSPEGFFETGHKKVYEITTREGFSFKATADHRVLMAPKVIRKRGYEEWREVQELGEGDKLILHEHPGLKWGGEGTEEEGWLLGRATGDRPDMAGFRAERASSAFCRGFLRGRFDVSGRVQEARGEGVSVRLPSTSLQDLQAVQRILARLGVVSATRHVTRPSQATHELVVSGSNLLQFAERVGFKNPDKANRFREVLVKNRANFSRERFVAEVGSIREVGTETVYDCTVPGPHAFDGNGFYLHNCSEIGLNPNYEVKPQDVSYLADRGVHAEQGETKTGFTFCNLSEVNVATCEGPQDLYDRARAAAIVGTLQAAYTDFPYLSPVSELLARREALIGVSLTGMMDNPDLAFDPEVQRHAAEVVKETNRELAEMIGINPAARCCTVKPSGTASLVLGCIGSGIHPHHARRYFRRVKASRLEAVYQHFRAENPHMCEEVSDTDDIITFCVEAPESAAVADDLSAIEFLDMVLSTHNNWIRPGTADDSHSPGLTHNISNTVVVKEGEWDAVREYLWNHREEFAGVSLLPYSSDKAYKNAPREAVVTDLDEEKWNYLTSRYTPVDYTTMFEAEDETDLQGEIACAGGACEVLL